MQLSRTQFPDLYASMDDFAGTLGVKPTPAIYLGNGNGTLNTFAAQSGWANNYVVVSLGVGRPDAPEVGLKSSDRTSGPESAACPSASRCERNPTSRPNSSEPGAVP